MVSHGKMVSIIILFLHRLIHSLTLNFWPRADNQIFSTYNNYMQKECINLTQCSENLYKICELPAVI